jgi:AcrR family transcriptional regulator
LYAKAAGYNNGLIFRYFNDKVGLYSEVLRRVDQEMGELLTRIFAPLLVDEMIVADAWRWRHFLRATVEAFFDFMIEHPQVARMLNWEQAEGWQTLAQIASQFQPGDLAKLEALFARARESGLLRADLDIVVMVILVEQVCWSSPVALSLYQSLLAGRELSSTAMFAHVREQIISFLCAGIMGEPEA